jgi:AcrR family transcriptional regulator
MAKHHFYVSEDDAPAKQRILTEALRLFSERGLAATTIRDIAKASGYTNPALYKHFASKEDLALHLFEVCHTRVWSECHAAIASAKGFRAKLKAYVGVWLELASAHPEVMAFLSDSARDLWPRANARVRKNTLIGLAQSLAASSPAASRRRDGFSPEMGAAMLQGTLAEVARMIQVGVLSPPPARWGPRLVRLFLTALS